MQAQYWQQVWQDNDIGFHQQQVNKLLLKCWPSVELASGSTVLVPLCGKSLDVLWFRKQGYRVIGIELSELALDELAEQMRSELGIGIDKTPRAQDVWYEGDGVLLIGGDFFSVRPEDLGNVDAVYDRGALVALPDAMRVDYCRQLHALSAGAKQLVMTFDYQQQLMAGPPFAISVDELEQHYGTTHRIRCVDERELIAYEHGFRALGLPSFIQRVHLLTALNG